MENEEVLPLDGEAAAFQVDTSLSPLAAVTMWAAEGNPPGQRVAYILSLPAVAAEVSLEDARTVLLPLVSQLVWDEHPDIKQAIAEVMGPLGPILAAKDPAVAEGGGSEDAFDLLALAQRLLLDPERAVQESAAASVAQIAGLLSPQHRRECLGQLLDELMANYDDEQMQECAVDLLTKVAASAGAAHPGWCEEAALPRMLKLALHRDYNIRVHAVSGLVQLAACLPLEVRCGEVAATFADLCGDPVWSVRQDCATELAALAACLPREAVRDRLLPLWQALAGDVSAWVKAAARRQAGPLLASLHPDDITDALIDCYVEAASGPATLTEACAHHLPAVAANLGPECWPRLKDAVRALAASEYVSVRVALAERVAELAALLGRERVAADLLPVIQKLSGDEAPAVADALAVNIRALLGALPAHARLGQLGFLARMHPEDGASCGQWRMRLLIAEQLAGIAALLGPQGLAEVLLPATLRLCEDPVAAVREAAACQLGAMLRGLLAGDGSGDEGTEAAAAEPAAPQQPAEVAVAGGGAEAAVAADAPAAQQQQQQQQPSAEQPSTEQGQQQQQQQQEGQDAPATEQPPQQQEQQQAAAAPADAPEVEEEEQGGGGGGGGGGPTAVVQQIVQHLVELQRSACHRSRQTYLTFCAALLLPQPQPAEEGGEQQQQGQQQQPGEAQREQEQQEPGQDRPEGQEERQPAAAPAWPQLPEAVERSGVARGLLEGAVALAADAVPNVRLSVARLLAALQQQQPRLAGSSPKLAAALQALAADTDRDVRAVAAGGC